MHATIYFIFSFDSSGKIGKLKALFAYSSALMKSFSLKPNFLRKKYALKNTTVYIAKPAITLVSNIRTIFLKIGISHKIN